MFPSCHGLLFFINLRRCHEFKAGNVARERIREAFKKITLEPVAIGADCFWPNPEWLQASRKLDLRQRLPMVAFAPRPVRHGLWLHVSVLVGALSKLGKSHGCHR